MERDRLESPLCGGNTAANDLERRSVASVVTEKYRPFVATSMTDLRVTVDGRDLEAVWTDDAPETRAALEDALPVSGRATRWGDELYFDVPIDVPAENAREVVPEGAIAYWPTGNVLCLFWGPTPASDGDEPRAASPVNVIAQVNDIGPLEDLDGGARVRLEQPKE